MRINHLGSNQTVVHKGEWSILFSYSTPVAAWNGNAYRTEQFHSVTTSKHINKWLDEYGAKERAEKKPQSWFNAL